MIKCLAFDLDGTLLMDDGSKNSGFHQTGNG